MVDFGCSQLHGDNAHLLYHVVWCLVQLCEDDPDCSALMRQMGAIPLLLALLQSVSVLSQFQCVCMCVCVCVGGVVCVHACVHVRARACVCV